MESEIARYATEALARFGTAGRVWVRDGRARLVGAGPDAEVCARDLLADWPSLSLELRQRRARDLARDLVNQRRESLRPEERGSGGSRALWIGLAVVLGTAGLGYRFRTELMDLTRGEAPAAASSGSVLAAAEAEREKRGATVCDAASSRVTQGATLGPSDVEGWVVELAFIRPGSAGDFARDPRFAELFRRRASGLQLLASEASGWGENTLRDVTAVSHPPAPATKLWELRVVLEGHAVDQYFREEGRSRFYRLAAQLADRLDATHGGVFARCASRATPHLGSWFRGPDDAGAAAALLYFLGTSREAPHVPLPLLDANDRGTLFEALVRASASLDRKQLARWIGRHDGSISGGKNTPVVVTFPYKDGGRGERASQDLARATHLVRDAL